MHAKYNNKYTRIDKLYRIFNLNSNEIGQQSLTDIRYIMVFSKQFLQRPIW